MVVRKQWKLPCWWEIENERVCLHLTGGRSLGFDRAVCQTGFSGRRRSVGSGILAGASGLAVFRIPGRVAAADPGGRVDLPALGLFSLTGFSILRFLPAGGSEGGRRPGFRPSVYGPGLGGVDGHFLLSRENDPLQNGGPRGHPGRGGAGIAGLRRRHRGKHGQMIGRCFLRSGGWFLLLALLHFR